MDTRQEEYILKIASEGNVTYAAEQLFISQSALTQQLQKIEAELGVSLFHRAKGVMKLTEAGRIYCEYAQRIVQEKKESYSILNDMANNQIGTLHIGLTRERGIDMFMNVYPQFYNNYPKIHIFPHELSVEPQQRMILKGELDFGFVTVSENNKLPGIEYINLFYENLLLAVPRTHPIAIKKANGPSEPFAIVDLKDLQNEKFVLMFKNSTMRSVIDPLFKEAGFSPDILFETSSNLTLRNMVSKNLACSIIPQNYALERDKIAYFMLPSQPFWGMNAIYRKGHYMTTAAKSFIAQSQDYFYNYAKKIQQDVFLKTD